MWTKKIVAAALSFSFIAICRGGDASAYSGHDYTAAQWSLRVTDMQHVWETATGSGVVVAVIDSGVDSSHPDLSGAVIPGYNIYTGGRFEKHESLEKSRDKTGHGTSVAGVISAKSNGFGVTGVAPNSTILPISIVGNENDIQGEVRQLALGVDLALLAGADIINISLGSYGDIDTKYKDIMCGAVKRAWDKGVISVVASGNGGYEINSEVFPASCPEAVSVGSVDSSLSVSPFSSYDPSVDFAAPGDYIVTTAGEQQDTLYTEESGTSMAAPFAAGVAALIKERNPDLTPSEILSRMTSSAVDLGPPGRDVFYGAGLLNPAGALGLDAVVKAVAHVSMLGPSRQSPNTVSVVPSKNTTFDAYEITLKDSTGGIETRMIDGRQVRFSVPANFDGTLFLSGITSLGKVESFPLTVRGYQEQRRSVVISRVRLTVGRDQRAVVRWSADFINEEDTGYFSVTLVDASEYLSVWDDETLSARAGKKARKVRMKFSRLHQYSMYAVVSWVSKGGADTDSYWSRVRKATSGVAIDYAEEAGDGKSVIYGHINNNVKRSVCKKHCGGFDVILATKGGYTYKTTSINDGAFIGVVPSSGGETLPVVATVKGKKAVDSGKHVTLKLNN